MASAEFLVNRPAYRAQDTARQIWLAGLGAFARAQQEGGQWFETLIQEGQAVDQRMKQISEEKIKNCRGEIEAMTSQVRKVQEEAIGAWNKLEGVFQRRVARALRRLNVPTQDDIQQLLQQTVLLSRKIEELASATEREAKMQELNAIKISKPARTETP